ncbi:DMT family transporter [Luteimonas sp. RD2P54]|uniref:DMT family transporter n=1 Tax=Luteimonas endophytica TaxID=3042023 RepID=A0ABT6JAR5_9GAMM|nr:DMT family transporter [Luteimonas endophytica]MDH5823922.1 DMT family transporter [Luteimonas endophytica]
MQPAMIGGILLALVVGVLLPLQALINARLGQATQGPLFASFASFLVGTLVLGAALLVTRTPWPSTQALGAQPPWVWLGGAIGALYVLSATVLVPRIGAAALICLVVFGQVAGSLLFDHYGVLNQARVLDPWRLAGAALVAVGAVMVVRPGQGG